MPFFQSIESFDLNVCQPARPRTSMSSAMAVKTAMEGQKARPVLARRPHFLVLPFSCAELSRGRGHQARWWDSLRAGLLHVFATMEAAEVLPVWDAGRCSSSPQIRPTPWATPWGASSRPAAKTGGPCGGSFWSERAAFEI